MPTSGLFYLAPWPAVSKGKLSGKRANFVCHKKARDLGQTAIYLLVLIIDHDSSHKHTDELIYQVAAASKRKSLHPRAATYSQTRINSTYSSRRNFKLHLT